MGKPQPWGGLQCHARRSSARKVETPPVEEDPPREQRTMAQRRVKGLEPCPACGKLIAPARRKVRHDLTPECLVRRTEAAYKARGWIQLSAPSWIECMKEAGVPLEMAPGGVHLEPRLVPSTKGPAKQAVVHDEVAHNEAYVPATAVRIVGALRRTQMPKGFRVRAVRALWDQDHVVDAIETIKSLGGRALGFIHRMVVKHEEEKGLTVQGKESDATEAEA